MYPLAKLRRKASNFMKSIDRCKSTWRWLDPFDHLYRDCILRVTIDEDKVCPLVSAILQRCPFTKVRFEDHGTMCEERDKMIDWWSRRNWICMYPLRNVSETKYRWIVNTNIVPDKNITKTRVITHAGNSRSSCIDVLSYTMRVEPYPSEGNVSLCHEPKVM